MIKVECDNEKADKGREKNQDRNAGSIHGQVDAFSRQYQLNFVNDDCVLSIWDRSVRFHAGWF